nr:MAG TPA: hypothetical protein [Caudoviricetes sp.]
MYFLRFTTPCFQNFIYITTYYFINTTKYVSYI